MNTLTIIFLILLLISAGIQFWLDHRQISHIKNNRPQVPDAFRGTISLEAHQKAANYTIDKNKINQVDRVVSLFMLLYFTLGGGINAISSLCANIFPDNATAAGTLLILGVFFIAHLVDLPLNLYQTFRIETRYGFNRSSIQQFIKDQILQLILAGIIGGLVISSVIWVMENTGSYWWLLAWAIIMVFSILMSWLFPTFIAPLFNTFSPLKDEKLKNKIESLLERCGFHSKGVYVMDNSKRSGHGNAYFTGIGNNKRIVFFDTLIEKLEHDELEAVLAHELGHFKRKHVTKLLISNALITLLSFALLGWLAQKSWFFSAFNVSEASAASTLLLFILISPVFAIFLQPVMAHFQRRFEFEADDFASQHSEAKSLVSALVKLYRDNASTLTPDPLYSAFHHSHPPASARIRNLMDKQVAHPGPAAA